MSMNAYFLAVDADRLERMRSGEEDIGPLVMRGSLAGLGELGALAHAEPIRWFGWPWVLLQLLFRRTRTQALFRILATLAARRGVSMDPAPAGEGVEPPDPADAPLSIHKDWQAVHWLLSGHPEALGDKPEGQAVLGGEDIGEDMGYGPARAFDVATTARIAAALAALPPKALAKRWDGRAMDTAEIYGGHWEEEGPHESVIPSYSKLRDLYEAAARDQKAVVTWLS